MEELQRGSATPASGYRPGLHVLTVPGKKNGGFAGFGLLADLAWGWGTGSTERGM